MATQPLPAARRPGRPAADAKAALREELITAALECFGAKGFDGASLSQIAGRVGTDVGLIRYYFGSKEDLWFAAVDHVAETLRAELVPILEDAHEGKSALLEAVIRWFVSMSARHPYLSRIIVLDGAGYDSRGRHIADNVIVGNQQLALVLVVGIGADLGLAPLVDQACRQGQVETAVKDIPLADIHGAALQGAAQIGV